VAERIIIWIIFGFALSMTPLVIVAGIGWLPASGIPGFMQLLCNEEMLAVALTLGGTAAADVLIRSTGPLRPLKLIVGGVTFLATVFSVAGYVIIKTHSSHLEPDQIVMLVEFAGGTTVVSALLCEILAEY
jgi:hypothetical protein